MVLLKLMTIKNDDQKFDADSAVVCEDLGFLGNFDNSYFYYMSHMI